MSSRPEWFKSSYSGQNGECVEVRLGTDAIGVRDSKDPAGGVLAVDAAAWADFVAAVRRGEFPQV
ncbi:DUF397 domain-containing protein [Streptomyces sp. NBC_01808]|uniref:DUF397 domain-containing protein n=1 Tax=Streptomyces sp. NBC_01808 TaxID=2975947 RepID=UPI002DDA054E|nr:DUF397 domain-containing protein [Streptomyces sp. NBC_01808]WSA38588.1 DUF397 domain-containing protein [Streptomyces sp. NBC_01808]